MSEQIESYWRLAREWWRARKEPHVMGCPCLPCADYRALLGRPITPPWPRPTQDRVPG